MSTQPSPVARILNLVREEKTDISAIYFYAIANGAIQLSLPLGIQAILGFIVAGTLSASLVLLISLLVAGVLGAGMLQMSQMKIIEKIQQKLFVRYSFAFANRIPRLDLKAVDGYYLPELINRFFDTMSLQKGISKLLLDLPVAVIQIVFGLTLLAFYHPAFILFGVLLVAVLTTILYYTGNHGLRSSLEESRYKYAVAGWLQEIGRAIHSFKFAADSPLARRRADDHTVSYLDARTAHFRVLLTQYRTLVVLKVLITAAMLIVGVALLLKQQINIGQFVAAEIIIVLVMNSVEKIMINLDSVYDVLTAIEKVSKLTDKPVERSGTMQLAANAPIALSARDLSLSFGNRNVLRHLSFDIKAGEKVLLTGANGSGKSTLLKLLAGAYQDFEGVLLINQLPLGNYDLDSLRSRAGSMFGGQQIFAGTLRENLTLGRPVSEEWLLHLVSQTGLSAYVEIQPLGFDSTLDPAGERLPRNLQHKILLVRAMAQNPALLLLEDPWNQLEEPCRSQVRELLFSLTQTTVVVCGEDAAYASSCSQIIQL